MVSRRRNLEQWREGVASDEMGPHLVNVDSDRVIRDGGAGNRILEGVFGSFADHLVTGGIW